MRDYRGDFERDTAFANQGAEKQWSHLRTLSDSDVAFELDECCSHPDGSPIGLAGEPWGANVGLLKTSADRIRRFMNLQDMFKEATGYTYDEYRAMKKEVRLEVAAQEAPRLGANARRESQPPVAASRRLVWHGPVNHETSSHCCGCWAIFEDGDELYAECNECDERRDLLFFLSPTPQSDAFVYQGNWSDSEQDWLVSQKNYDELLNFARKLEDSQADLTAAAIRSHDTMLLHGICNWKAADELRHFLHKLLTRLGALK